MAALRVRAGFALQQGMGGGLARLTGLRLASSASDKNPPSGQVDPQGVQDQLPRRDQPRHVPGEEELGSEKEVKWGVNIPASGEQLAEELKYAGRGLAESVGAAASAVFEKGREAVDEAKRAVGMETERKQMSHEHMGAAGKMQHAAPGVKDESELGNAPITHAREKYDEIKGTEAANFPEGERSVTEQWRSAGSYQNSPEAAAKLAATPEEQHAANVEIRREMKGGAIGGGAGNMDESFDTGSGLEENLHKRGP